jgi:2,3-bisphosphoglycerate-dependent phosphoglycerate mutase
MSAMGRTSVLVLVRHGESVWNRDRRFTGWADVGLTEAGLAQMRHAAHALVDAGIDIDLAFTSVLTRCIKSQWQLLDAMDCPWVPQVLEWRLNERHYGGLTGRSKDEAVAAYGAEAVQRWRRDYTAEPPPLDAVGAGFVTIDRRYASLPPSAIPIGESLQQAAGRVAAAWHDAIAPALRSNKRVLVVGHGNGLRALIKTLEGVSDDDIARIEVDNGVPIVYELYAGLQPISKHELAVPPWPRSTIL